MTTATITLADWKRARAFGLALPAGAVVAAEPVALPAPAVVVPKPATISVTEMVEVPTASIMEVVAPAPTRKSCKTTACYARYGVRAPKGGCTVAGKVYRGGQFSLAYDASNPHGTGKDASRPATLAYDITRQDGTVRVSNPATGGVEVFRIAEGRGNLAGKRMVSRLVDGEWQGFAFADEFGVRAWRSMAGNPRIAGRNGYIAILTESARLAATKGLEYRWIEG